jgi:hypothetical protein
MRTLAEVNEGTTVWHREGDDYTTRTEYAVGSFGRRHTGQKTHMLYHQVVVELLGDGPHRYKVGDVFRWNVCCNGNGHNGGQADSRLDTKDITCTKCGGGK